MTDRLSTGAIPASGSPRAAPAPQPQRDEGAVLRGVALHAEPRFLGGRGTLLRRRTAVPPPAAPVDGMAAEHSSAPFAEPVYGPRDRAGGSGDLAEAASAYDLGRRAGRAEVEAELASARAGVLEAAYREGLARGEAEGRERGFAAGADDGRRALERELLAAREATAARLAVIERARAELTAELNQRIAHAEDDMVALSHAVVCRILGERLVTREGVAHHVGAALREAAGDGLAGPVDGAPIAIHLHPTDVAALEGDPAIAGWLRAADAGGAPALRWVPDPRVTVGGCTVRTADGTLDARLEVQMAALRRTLVEARSSVAASPGPAASAPRDGETP